MKKILCVSLMLFAATALFAWSPTLCNQDSTRYDYKLACGASTLNSYVGSNTTVTLRGGCKLVVEGVGSADVSDDMKCTIKNRTLTCSK